MVTLILRLGLSLAISLQPKIQAHVTDADLAVYQAVLRWSAEEYLDGVGVNNLVRRRTIAIDERGNTVAAVYVRAADYFSELYPGLGSWGIAETKTPAGCAGVSGHAMAGAGL